MTNDDVLFGFRLRVFDLAARTSVANACRVFGVHRSTFYAWKRQVDRPGLQMLRPPERRAPLMPNQTHRLRSRPLQRLRSNRPPFILRQRRRAVWVTGATNTWGVLKILCSVLGNQQTNLGPVKPTRQVLPE